MIAPTWSSPVRFPEADALTDATPALLAAAGDHLQVVDGDVRLDTAGLRAAVAAQQARLRAAGVRRGDVVAVQLPNWWEAVSLAHAVWGMGAVLCPVPVNYRTAELVRILNATSVAAVVVPVSYRGTDHPALVRAALDRAAQDRAAQDPAAQDPAARDPAVQDPAARDPAPPGRAAPDVPVLVVRGVEAVPAAAGEPELVAEMDSVCVVMFTSGTTGVPKGVLHSHRTLLADAASITRLYGLTGDRVYMPSPVGHVTGLVYGVLMPLLMDGAVVLQAEWDAAAGADLVEREGCTFCVGATPFLRGLTDEYARRGRPSSLTGFACGGADVPPALVTRAIGVLDAVVARAYGLTEMPTVTCGGPADPESVRVRTDGRLTGSSEARLAAPVDGVGELEVRGPELCLGYLDPAHTAASFTADGWFRTGDLATLSPDGTVTITGRAKDVIVRGGENIAVKEVEDHLLNHPGVADVAIVGVPDDVLGERGCAVVVPGPAAPSLADLTGFLLRQDIAKFKLPEYLLLVERLPRTPSGKVQKFRLRAEAAVELAAGRGERR